MDELSIKSIIEKHIENIFGEIWKPFEADFSNKFQKLEKENAQIKRQLTLIKNKISKLANEPKQDINNYEIDSILTESNRINQNTKHLFTRINATEKNIKNEIYNNLNNNASEITIFINNLVRKAINDQSRDFEYRCAAYMRAVEMKLEIHDK